MGHEDASDYAARVGWRALYALGLMAVLVTLLIRTWAEGISCWLIRNGLFPDVGSTWLSESRRRPNRSGSSLCSANRARRPGLRPLRPQVPIAEPNGKKDRQRTQEDEDQVAWEPQPFQQAR
jgi:hypothetical protein